MSLRIILGVISLSVLSRCALAQFGSCSTADLSAFVTSLPSACSSTVFAAINPGDATPEQLDAVLATFCHVNCGEVVLDYLLETCQSVGLALVLNLNCLPTQNTSNLGNYCQHSTPGRIDVSLINQMASCADFSISGTCSDACAAGLTAARNAFGCCYQTILNNSDVLNGYLQAQLISRENVTLLNNVISNYSLWSECGVVQVDECNGYPFPGRSTEVGICTNEQVDEHMSSLTEECQAFTRMLIDLNNDRSAMSQMNFDVVCTSECGGSFSDFQSTTCRNEFLSTLAQEVCLKTDGSQGGRCYFTLFETTIDQLLVDAAVCVTSSADRCPSGCAAALQSISTTVGCCYQNIYNNSRFLDALLLFRDEFNYNAVTLYKVLGSYQLWDICGIPLVEECQGEPFAGGAVQFSAPVALWILVQILSMLLY